MPTRPLKEFSVKTPNNSPKTSTSSNAKSVGSSGGKAGGPARAAKLTAQQRSDIAKKGGQAKGRK